MDLPSIFSTFHQTHITPTKPIPTAVNSSSFCFETPHKVVPALQPVTNRTRPSPITATTKLRPKSLFVTPTILNDATALSKLQQIQSPTYDMIIQTPCSSSTIHDAESILTSSSSSSSSSTPLCHQQRKRTTRYNSLPTLNVPQAADLTITPQNEPCCNQNESGAELDQISDLTSKMFSSAEEAEDDVGLGVSGTSTSSSSTIPSWKNIAVTMKYFLRRLMKLISGAHGRQFPVKLTVIPISFLHETNSVILKEVFEFDQSRRVDRITLNSTFVCLRGKCDKILEMYDEGHVFAISFLLITVA